MKMKKNDEMYEIFTDERNKSFVTINGTPIPGVDSVAWEGNGVFNLKVIGSLASRESRYLFGIRNESGNDNRERYIGRGLASITLDPFDAVTYERRNEMVAALNHIVSLNAVVNGFSYDRLIPMKLSYYTTPFTGDLIENSEKYPHLVEEVVLDVDDDGSYVAEEDLQEPRYFYDVTW